MAAAARVVMDPEAINRMLSGPQGPVAYNLRLRGKKAATRARQLAPGHMKYYIKSNWDSGHVRLECNHHAAVFVLKGTRWHFILPRTAGVLAFHIGGKKVFARIVEHPGNKANNFLLKALRSV